MNDKFIKVLPEIQHLDFNKCDIALSLFTGDIPTIKELNKLKNSVSTTEHKDFITKRIKTNTEVFKQIEELANFYKISKQNMFNIIFLWGKDNELLKK